MHGTRAGLLVSVVKVGAHSGQPFSMPGTFTYICKDHPWAYGQIIVTE